MFSKVLLYVYSVLAIGLSIIECNRIKQDVSLQSEYVFFY